MLGWMASISLSGASGTREVGWAATAVQAVWAHRSCPPMPAHLRWRLGREPSVAKARRGFGVWRVDRRLALRRRLIAAVGLRPVCVWVVWMSGYVV